MNASGRLLVFLPTYNEADNVGTIYSMVRDTLPDADILFIDDNSPDGTGDILDTISVDDTLVSVIHRSGKLGIGSAHADAINWAYDNNFQILLSMDCDLAHSPEYIPAFLAADQSFAVVAGSRFKLAHSLREWNLYRKLLTHLGHFLTRFLLGMPFDATGAFRRYDLRLIPREFLSCVHSTGYSFFFESIHVLYFNNFAIHEIPIHLPARTYGASKMRLKDVFVGFRDLIRQSMVAKFTKTKILITSKLENSPEAWDTYWNTKQSAKTEQTYDAIASFYRQRIIKPCLNYHLRKHFPAHAKILHAGCGSGAVDEDVHKEFDVTACDFSDLALENYRAIHGSTAPVVKADLFDMKFGEHSFDGIYNLGVMEHFSWPEISQLLSKFHHVLKPDGRLVLFWPPVFGLSVLVLGFAHFVLNDLLGKNLELHPPEPSKVPSRRFVEDLLMENGFRMDGFYFGPRDIFTHAVIVARRVENIAD